MIYRPSEFLQYLNGLYNGAYSALTKKVHKLLSETNLSVPSGLEFALAGMPNNPVKEKPLQTKSKTNDYVHLSSSIKEYNVNGSAVVVRRNGDGKEIALRLGDIKGTPEQYVKQVLSNHGIRPESSKIKKIVRLLNSLNGKKQ